MALRRRHGRKPGDGGPGNPYPEVDPSKYDVSILAALDHLGWADRLGVPGALTDDELLIEVSRSAAKTQAHRAAMVLERVRLVELTIYACERIGLDPIKVAKAAGMRRQVLDRWLRSYRGGH